MNDKHKNDDREIEEALITLDQLGHTLTVMSGVVERLKEQFIRRAGLPETDAGQPVREPAEPPPETDRPPRRQRWVELTGAGEEEGEDPVLH